MEQEASLETQISTYKALIMHNSEWELVDIYADKGKSATSARHRPEFQRMISDALEGKIDLILVKSISRFARNVVDCQTYVEMLRAKGVEIRFERENLCTLNPATEMIFSMMAAMAQDESRSISENVKWAFQRRAARGECRIGSNKVLGYDEVNGKLMPNDDAWVIWMAFDLFNQGMPYAKIAETITAAGGKRMRGSTPLDSASIRRIVENEIYVGDRLMQKRAPKHYLTKRPDINAQYQSWYWRDTHEGIIDRHTWDKAQEVLEARKKEVAMGIQRKGKKTHFLYGKLFCGLCGKPLTRNTLCGTSKKEVPKNYYKAWICRDHLKKNGCPNTYIREDKLLRVISERMGWQWNGNAAFDVGLFQREVSTIEVTNGEVSMRSGEKILI